MLFFVPFSTAAPSPIFGQVLIKRPNYLEKNA